MQCEAASAPIKVLAWQSALLHAMHGCQQWPDACRMLWNIRAVPLGKRPHLRPRCYSNFLLSPTVLPCQQLVTLAQHPLAASCVEVGALCPSSALLLCRDQQGVCSQG